MNVRRSKIHVVLLVTVVLLATVVYATSAWTAVPVVDDPLVRMPGTQPGQVTLEDPTRCLNCHSGYDIDTEPGYNWKGSMMAQAARDFLYLSCLTVAGQDSIWAVGRPNAIDICERCHFPKGWLEGRSDPPNASAMVGADYDGVQCDFCHRMWDPFFDATFSGAREGSDWLGYWDETNASGTPSSDAAAATHAEDGLLAQGITLFNGGSFYLGNEPPGNYLENGSGQYFVSPNAGKRASFADAAARHQMFYSRYHKSKYFCNSCHDVSNPVLANLGADPANPLRTEQDSAYTYFHVERTFSEFMLSAYGQQGGAATNDDFRNQGAPDILHVTKCQDCHMRDVVGKAAGMRNAIVRPTDSLEHPESGQPLHDLTGGNMWVSAVLASAIPGSANYDAYNDQQLNQGPAVLTLDLTQGEGIDPAALLAGVDRAEQQLLLAATITNLTYDTDNGQLSFRVQNNTGHKLISGFPEGRRMFVNVKLYDASGLIHEVNPYDSPAGTLRGLSYSYLGDGDLPDPIQLASDQEHIDRLVYEMHPESYLTGETDKTFHFALATGRHKDNRIPPRGFDIANARFRESVPVYYENGVDQGADTFTASEYVGGYDEVSLTVPSGASYVEVNLYYQTTSREYIEFLRDEIRGTGNLTLSDPSPGGDPAYLIQTDPFFSQLKAWGDTIWNLWTHNMQLPGAAPFLMASASSGTPPQPGCNLPAPVLDSATPGNQQVTIAWSPATGATGYEVYHDQAGKAQFIADAGNVTSYVDAGLTNGVAYCYKVTAYDATCTSGFSNVLCATPTNQGQATLPASVSLLETGIYDGKGGNRTYTSQTAFTAGDSVVFRATVEDQAGQPLAGATVDLLITGPEGLTVTSAPSDASGIAEATWQTKSAGKRNTGTTPGAYTVTVKGISLNGYQWDGVTTSAAFTIQ